MVVEAFELVLRARQVNCCKYPARQGIAGVVYQVQWNSGVTQQLYVERGEHGSHPPRFMLEPLDQHGERLLTQMHLNLVQRVLNPQHLGGHRHAIAAHRQCLGFQPFTVLLHIALAHDRQGLVVDQPGSGQALKVVKGDDVQWHALGFGQGRRTVINRRAAHQGRCDQKKSLRVGHGTPLRAR
ncbi:hypothetical protein D3C79_876930 [compost metagenome]